jgi:GT2 family glycosyltransferase
LTRPALSVVVPTIASRGAYLHRCLAALSRCHGREALEILVVSEEPSALEDRLGEIGRGLDIRVVPGPAPAARKRNAGTLAARADVIAFLDDDTRPDPGWARALLAAFANGQDAIAGRVVPDFEAPIPDYLAGREDVVRGFNALGPWRRDGFVIGCNVAFRRRVFERVGLFSPDFGRRGARYHTGDETEFVRRVSTRYEVRYCEEAGVVHAIQPRRMTKAYLQERAWWAGRANAGIDELHRPGFVRGAITVAFLLPMLLLRVAAQPRAVPPRLPVIHAISYLKEAGRLLVFGRGPVSPVPRIGPPAP